MAFDRERLSATGHPVATTRETGARPQRIPLGRSRRRSSYERRFRLWLLCLALPVVGMCAWLTYLLTSSASLCAAAAVTAALLWTAVTSYLFEQMTRPLQTLSNVVAALREEDFSFRARGARPGDSLGDLALEINALASTLQSQRAVERDALSLVERVLTAMQTPVLAFGPEGELRLFNKAAATSFHLDRALHIGVNARQCGVADLLTTRDQELWPEAALVHTGAVRWSVRRTHFRLQGVPHELFVLSDVGVALRAEERTAWQRLIRVLSHEVNNSLTPIKSIAGSLHALTSSNAGELFADTERQDDLRHGLSIIEERAASLNRFLQAYQQLTRLPPPSPRLVDLGPLAQHVASLETRVPIQVESRAETQVYVDPDQLNQLLINLIRNAGDAALEHPSGENLPSVSLTWEASTTGVRIMVRDSGTGLANPGNLFVPFYTTKPHGSGIGLVLAQQIATAHRGTLSLENNENGPGCTATLYLPRNI